MRSDIVRGGYNKMAREYMAERDKLKSGKYVQKLLKLLPKKSTILDVGCGAGVGVDEILLKAGHEVIGIDNSEVMIRLARKYCPGGEYYIKNILELREREYSVNAVVSFYALFHVARERLADVIRLLMSYVEKSGYLLITLGDKEFEGEHELYGEKMWSSQWSASHNRAMIVRLGLEILIDEIDRSGGESHQVLLLRKSH